MKQAKGNNIVEWLCVLFLAVPILGVIFLVILQQTCKPADVDTEIANNSQVEKSTPKADNANIQSLRAKYKNKQVGEHFQFGSYPQSSDGAVKKIGWRVLQRDRYSLLVISDKALDVKPYHARYIDITWKKSSLRRWLNSEFLRSAFSKDECLLIELSNLSNNRDPSTKDYIFLLSAEEVKSLFTDNIVRMAKPTDYVLKNGVYNYNDKAVCWWLRSRSKDHKHMWCVDLIGNTSSYGVNSNKVCVRPALRLAL